MPELASEYSRRNLLRIGGGVLALIIGGGAGWLGRRGDHTGTAGLFTPTTLTPPSSTSALSKAATTEPPAELISLLDTTALSELDPAIADLGWRYLASHPSEASLSLLLDRLPPPADNPLEAATTAISGEFRRGDTVSVDGWVLAASEARAAAVVALVCGDGAC